MGCKHAGNQSWKPSDAATDQLLRLEVLSVYEAKLGSRYPRRGANPFRSHLRHHRSRPGHDRLHRSSRRDELVQTFALYAGAIICFGGLIFAGIRMMSGHFQDAIPGLFGALFGAGVLGWGAGWIGSLTGQQQ